MSSYNNCGAQITNIDRLAGNDLTDIIVVRYRLASDPDIDASYTVAPWTMNLYGIIIPYFDINEVPPGIYVIHTYTISEGSSTGGKMTIEVTDCAAP